MGQRLDLLLPRRVVLKVGRPVEGHPDLASQEYVQGNP
jgi:hypothetical protein